MTKPTVPWQVRSAVILAHPQASWQNYMRWDGDTWIAVTATEDLETRYWKIVQDDPEQFSIYEVRKD